jgi:hypothetical protein
MNKQTRIKSTMRTRIALLSIAGLMASFTQAGPVDPSAITTFEAGQPARAAEVNANFDALITAIDDNASQLASSGQDVAIEVDCGDVREALQQAIDGSDPTKPLRINVLGTATCGPIAVRRDNVSVKGGNDTDTASRTIGTDGDGNAPVWVEGARHVTLSNLTIDAADGGTSEVGVAVAKGALVNLDFVSVQNSTAEAVTVFVNSTAVLSGTNTFAGGSGRGLNIGGNATVFAENGETTISSTGGEPVLEMDANAVFGGGAAVNLSSTGVPANGTSINVAGNSYLGLENGSIELSGELEVRRSLVLIEPSGDGFTGPVFTLTAAAVDLLPGSRVVLASEDGASIESTGSWFVNNDSSVVAVGTGTTLGGGSVFAQFGGTFGAGDGTDLNGMSGITARWNGQLILGGGMPTLTLLNDAIRVFDGGSLFSFDPALQTTDQVNCSRPQFWPAVTTTLSGTGTGTTDNTSEPVTVDNVTVSNTVSNGFAVAIADGVNPFADLCL